MVSISKLDGWIKIYMDFRDIHKEYPKDYFPFANIVILVNYTTRYELLSPMRDGFFRYNQIWVVIDDKHKINFTIPLGGGIFCYKFIPLLIINTRNTYQ